ncbi:hypothetical protein J6590_088074 [Homalodisca vitripennis]|nr:hypothetical protein J6590_088074 [Homalodisca vitripennis]
MGFALYRLAKLWAIVKGNPKLFVSNGYYHQYPTRSRELISVAAHSTSAFEKGPYHLVIYKMGMEETIR